MMWPIGSGAVACVVLLSTLALSPTANAARLEYPSRPIRVIVPQGAGASTDTITRLVTTKMTEVLGQQFVIDNRPGAGGIMAGELAATANPDGYTIYATGPTPQVIAPQVIKAVPFDPINSFAPICLFAVTHNVLVVHPSMPSSVKEFIGYVKTNPGKVNLANAGSATQSHLAGVLLARATGMSVTHVPYKGGGASVVAVVANESQATITPAPAVLGHVRAKRLRALASGGAVRSRVTPDLPTLIESGIGLETTGWIGFLAPRDTPVRVTDKLLSTMQQVVNQPTTQKLMEDSGADWQFEGPQAFRRFLLAEYKRFGEAIRIAGLKTE